MIDVPEFRNVIPYRQNLIDITGNIILHYVFTFVHGVVGILEPRFANSSQAAALGISYSSECPQIFGQSVLDYESYLDAQSHFLGMLTNPNPFDHTIILQFSYSVENVSKARMILSC